MSWVTVIGSMSAATLLTLAGVYLLLWLRSREVWVNLLFSISATAAATTSVLDLMLLRAHTPAQFGEILRWLHVPLWVITLSFGWFFHFYVGTGRTWLLWLASGVRTAALLLNFTFTLNLNFREITALKALPLLGELVSVPVGVTNPWTLVGQGSLLLFLIYVVDGTIMAWRKGSRGGLLATGSAIGLGLFMMLVGTVCVLWLEMPLPYIPGLVFLGIVLVMGYELSRNLFRASQLSRELHASEERMSLAITAADIALWEWNVTEDVFWTSDRCRTRMVLADSERLDYRRFLQLLHPADRDNVSQALAKSMSGDGNYSGEHRVLLPDGEVRWITAAGKVEFDNAGKPLRVRGISMDVTRLKQAELQIRHQRDELAHLSRMAMLGELSGSLAHELNQPLAAILCNAQAAQRFLSHDPPDLQEVQEILEDIIADDWRAGEVIRRLRLLFQQGEVQMQGVDLNELVPEVIKMVRSDIVTRNVDLNMDLSRGLPVIQGDRVQLQQVLLNLITNACNAMTGVEPGNRKLVVRTGLAPGEGIRVTVADRGPGIPPESLERIFDAFYTTNPQGMGFGLSVCHTIIDAHGGKLWAENNDDRGASFHFVLPEETPPTANGSRIRTAEPARN